MTNVNLANDLLRSLSYIRFAGNNHEKETKEAVYRYISVLWESNKLPVELKKGVWLVGWKVYHTFFGTSLFPITVGPAKPSKLRSRYYEQVISKVRLY